MYQEASNTTLLMLLNTAIYPFLASLVASFLAIKFAPKWRSAALFVSFLIGLILVYTALSFPPKQALDYLLVSAGLGLLLDRLRIQNTLYSAAIGFCAACFAYFLLLNPVLKHSTTLMAYGLPLICAILSMLWLTIRSKDMAPVGLSSANKTTSLLIVAGLSAPIIGIGGSLLVSQIVGVVAASLFAYLIIHIFFQQKQDTVKHLAVFLVGGLLIQAHVLVDIPLWLMGAMAISSFTYSFLSYLKPNYWFALLGQITITSTIAIIGLWTIWPQDSLY